MSTLIKEEDIEFDFGDSWKVLKYDESPEYKRGIRKLSGIWKRESDGTERHRGSKGIDILASRGTKRVLLIEVKDFRKAQSDPEPRIRDELPLEVAFKACDTVAGVIGSCRLADSAAIFHHISPLLIDDGCSLEVVLWLEVTSGSSDIERKRRKSLLSVTMNKLKQSCVWLTKAVFVVCADDYEAVLDDLVVQT